MITVDEGPNLETFRTINWLKTRTELLLSKELNEEALSLIAEFDDPLEALCENGLAWRLGMIRASDSVNVYFLGYLFPLSNQLNVCVFMGSLIAWLILEKP